MTETAARTWKIGDVIEDSYANPAVIVKVVNGQPYLILQTVGSDRGRLTGAPLLIREIEGNRAEWAREVGREEWRRQNLGQRLAD